MSSLACDLRDISYARILDWPLLVGHYNCFTMSTILILFTDESTFSFYTHSVNEEIKHLDDLFDSTRTVFVKMNGRFEVLFFFILVNLLTRIIIRFYEIAYFFRIGEYLSYLNIVPLLVYLVRYF